MMQTPITHCRCGGTINKRGECSKYRNEGNFVKHDIVAQDVNSPEYPNWDVRPEGDKFKAWAGSDEANQLFNTERKAWVELDKVYWGRESKYWENN